MIRSILIGVDGSEYAKSALELSLRWAKTHDSLLVGQGIIDEAAIRSPEPVALGAGAFKRQRDDARCEQAQRDVQQWLAAFAQRCTEAGVKHKTLEAYGNPSEILQREAQRYDLIVLGQKTFFESALQETPCETCHQVVRDAPRPVVLAPKALPPEGPVMIAYDGSLQAARALEAFQALELGRGQTTHIVTIGDDHTAGAKIAARALEFLHLHGIEAKPKVVVSSLSVGHVLLQEAQEIGAGMIVMGAYGKPFLQEFFFGSATKTLLETSPLPIFLYH